MAFLGDPRVREFLGALELVRKFGIDTAKVSDFYPRYQEIQQILDMLKPAVEELDKILPQGKSAADILRECQKEQEREKP